MTCYCSQQGIEVEPYIWNTTHLLIYYYQLNTKVARFLQNCNIQIQWDCESAKPISHRANLIFKKIYLYIYRTKEKTPLKLNRNHQVEWFRDKTTLVDYLSLYKNSTVALFEVRAKFHKSSPTYVYMFRAAQIEAINEFCARTNYGIQCFVTLSSDFKCNRQKVSEINVNCC